MKRSTLTPAPAFDSGTAPEAFFGRMNDPTVAAWVTGPCGDTMEIYLVIARDRITDCRYYTDGCETTRACGAELCRMVCGRAVEDVLAISARDILDGAAIRTAADRHCAVLAVSALYRTIGVYWTTP